MMAPGKYQDTFGAQIEALQYSIDIEQLRDFTTVDGELARASTCYGKPLTLTPKGREALVIERGDWVIKHSDGSFTTLGPNIFASRYTEVP